MILLVPIGNLAVLYLAVAELSFTVASAAEPLKNVTLPVGTPVPDWGETVAVNTTDLPDADGFADEVRVVVVAPGEPICTT
jgi:hypothetical protein